MFKYLHAVESAIFFLDDIVPNFMLNTLQHVDTGHKAVTRGSRDSSDLAQQALLGAAGTVRLLIAHLVLEECTIHDYRTTTRAVLVQL